MAAIIGLMLGGRRSVKKNEIPHQLDLISVKRYLTYSKTDKIFFLKKTKKKGDKCRVLDTIVSKESDIGTGASNLVFINNNACPTSDDVDNVDTSF